MRRLFPSHPDWKRINDLSLTIACAVNPQVHWNMRFMDLADTARLIVPAEVELAALLDSGSVFVSYVLDSMGEEE